MTQTSFVCRNSLINVSVIVQSGISHVTRSNRFMWSVGVCPSSRGYRIIIIKNLSMNNYLIFEPVLHGKKLHEISMR